ncbi:Cytochrome c [Planctomycetes bacterium Poly30]|uniref:Cytochrome c n=1 Tax=Saltatorellus ferox TaxID=2528018 RepID=A0A518EL33_9BACT|nr:Cytochrome c [Planctomycetes bacterium Poly30]
MKSSGRILSVPLAVLSCLGAIVQVSSSRGTLTLDEAAAAGEEPRPLPAGLRILYETPMQSFRLDRDLFMGLWRQWPAGAERTQAAEFATSTSNEEARAALYSLLLRHYGLHLDPRRGNDVPAAFATPPVGDGEPEGEWTMNCLVCHGGSMAGRFQPGLPNHTLMLEALVTDVVAAKMAGRSGLDDGMAMAQLGHTIGTTEATLFGEVLLRFREPNMDLRDLPGLVRAGSRNVARLSSLPEGLLALDAPAWWQLRHKTHMYLDHSVEKNHRTVMQFTLGLDDMAFKPGVREIVVGGTEAEVRKVLGRIAAKEVLDIREIYAEESGEIDAPEEFLLHVTQSMPRMPLLAQLALSRHIEPAGIHGETIRGWDDEFQEIFRFIDSTQPPPYPGEIDAVLAEEGRALYDRTCARCHGHHDGSGPAYVSRRVDLDVIGTDPLYPTALDQTFRDSLVGFLTERSDGTQVDIATDAEADEGYVAPPLNGVWASAPYLHNGSVPTVEHLLDHERRIELEESGQHAWIVEDPEAYDHEGLGLRARFLSGEEREQRSRDHRVRDSKRRGMSAEGHDFGAVLDASERRAVIEYLKTL